MGYSESWGRELGSFAKLGSACLVLTANFAFADVNFESQVLSVPGPMGQVALEDVIQIGSIPGLMESLMPEPGSGNWEVTPESMDIVEEALKFHYSIRRSDSAVPPAPKPSGIWGSITGYVSSTWSSTVNFFNHGDLIGELKRTRARCAKGEMPFGFEITLDQSSYAIQALVSKISIRLCASEKGIGTPGHEFSVRRSIQVELGPAGQALDVSDIQDSIQKIDFRLHEKLSEAIQQKQVELIRKHFLEQNSP